MVYGWRGGGCLHSKDTKEQWVLPWWDLECNGAETSAGESGCRLHDVAGKGWNNLRDPYPRKVQKEVRKEE